MASDYHDQLGAVAQRQEQEGIFTSPFVYDYPMQLAKQVSF